MVPRIHDCIGIFLGSHAAYQQEMAREPAFFLTQGYIAGYVAENSGPLSDFERTAKRYGKQRAEKLIGDMMKPYKRLVYIRTPGALDLEADRAYSRDMAEHFTMKYEEREGTTELLHKMVNGTWDRDFIVASPGQELTLENFMN